MIVSMKKITLISLKSLENELLKAIQELGAVEVIAPTEDNESYSLNSELFSELEGELKRLDNAVESIKPFAKKPGLLTPDPELEKTEIENSKQQAVSVCLDTETINSKIRYIKSEKQKREQQYELLSDWRGLDTEFEKLKNTKHTKILCGYVPRENASLLYELPCALTVLPCDNPKLYPCMIIYHKDQKDELSDKLREIGFSETVFPKELKGDVTQNLNRLHDEISELDGMLAKLNDELSQLSDKMVTLLAAKDVVSSEYERLKAMADILRSKSAFILSGWVREDETQKVENTIKNITDAYYLEISDPKKGDDVPIVTKNNEFVSPFESVVDMYSKPSYKGIDATPLTTPFYILFFGMMLADVGYGLILFIGCLIYEKLKKPRGGMKGLVGVIKWSGLSTAVCGILFGALFGIDIDNIFGTQNVFPLIMDPMQNVMEMLYLSCGLGIAQMLFGIGIKMYMCIKEGDVSAAIYDNLSWILIIVGILGAALIKAPFNTPFIIFAAIGALLIIIFGGRNKAGIMKIFGGLGSLYNITGWVSDIVSYARIFALGLVGGAMGEVFNMIGAMLASAGNGFVHVIFVILAGVVLIAMHLFGLFINTLGAYAHTARLQYVEFFGKFYEPGGRAFKPLSINSSNVRVKDDDNLQKIKTNSFKKFKNKIKITENN